MEGRKDICEGRKEARKDPKKNDGRDGRILVKEERKEERKEETKEGRIFLQEGMKEKTKEERKEGRKAGRNNMFA